ncbi:FkbM family methyltransferase [Pedobacter duraquae]|uniref:FkbM family methyltransferase n=1 Tax=Pedobacter duraquae TaxID=425511 RepID=A0A4R6IBV1_9SPHI|nr:FkbM family methyltransferase [Pedobacter duraquae]TDO19086.1 FkbM family methyltransferase [Pedobacter duraquae]
MLRTLKFIASHPLTRTNKIPAMLHFLSWQLGSRLSKKPSICNFTESTKLIAWPGLTGATGNVYCGLHEFEDMGFLLHFLKPSDLFVDIGANIGSYTILASADIKATVIAIEPLPATFHILLQNIAINQAAKRTETLNIALGAKKDTLKFTRTHDTGNHIAAAGETDVVEVPVNTLDNVLYGKVPSLIKIDVEGYEAEVLSGATNTLNDPALKAIIIELNASGGRYGHNEEHIHNNLIKLGFTPMQYDPFKRALSEAAYFGTHNTIYIRDLEFVEARLQQAQPFHVRGQHI